MNDKRKLENSEMIEWKDLDKMKFFVINPIIFFGVRFALYPVNLVKTRFQVQINNSLYSGLSNAFWKILKNENIKGFYRGFGINVLGVAAIQTHIVIYELAREQLAFINSSAMRELTAGALASVVQHCISVPIDVLSQYRIVQHVCKEISSCPRLHLLLEGTGGRGTMSIARNIINRDGIAGLYRGYVISLLTNVPNSAIWWCSYSFINRLYNHHHHHHHHNNNNNNNNTVLRQCVASSLACIISVTATNPIDIIRTRIQLGSNRNVANEITQIIRNEGLFALFNGLHARLLTAAPYSIAFVITYEYVKKLCLI